MGDKEEIIVVTTRCIDNVAYFDNIDKIKCSKCGEMTWLSISWRGKKIDKVICAHCFEKDEQKKVDYSACVTKACLNDALKHLKDTLHLEGTDDDIKERMIRCLERKLGKRITITD